MILVVPMIIRAVPPYRLRVLVVQTRGIAVRKERKDRREREEIPLTPLTLRCRRGARANQVSATSEHVENSSANTSEAQPYANDAAPSANGSPTMPAPTIVMKMLRHCVAIARQFARDAQQSMCTSLVSSLD
jgi:hypothetical protein